MRRTETKYETTLVWVTVLLVYLGLQQSVGPYCPLEASTLEIHMSVYS